MGYKAYSDSYLMSLTKAQIIELLRVAEHNFFATEEALNNSAKAGMEIAEKYDKAKRLLKLALQDLAEAEPCSLCKYDDDIPTCQSKPVNCFVWRYADEALKLIGESSV